MPYVLVGQENSISIDLYHEDHGCRAWLPGDTADDDRSERRVAASIIRRRERSHGRQAA